MSAPTDRWKCDDCNVVTIGADLLVAAHPFDPFDEVHGCPECKGMEFHLVCDEPGCTGRVTCGTPTADGYRSTCGAHEPLRTYVSG